MRYQATKSNIASKAGRVVAALMIIPLLGCASSQAAAPAASPTPSVSVPADRWEAILADLAKRGVDTTSVTVVSSEDINWPDSSIGCPEEGKMYPQSLVKGYQVIVKVGDKTYDYHFGTGSSMLLCEK